MMKNKNTFLKLVFVSSVIVLSFVNLSCSENKSNVKNTRTSKVAKTSDVIESLKQNYDEQKISSEEQVAIVDEADSKNDLATKNDTPSNIDIDLTSLSATMVYAEIFNMVTDPYFYIGKTVKMQGNFYVYTPMLPDGPSDRNFYTCIIEDATACCQQGLEFDLANKTKKYPEDFPSVGNEITVIGTVDVYDIGGYTFLRIKDASFV